MEKEIWKDIPEFEGYYQISNFGNYKSLDRVVERKHLHPNRIKGKVIKYLINRTGYYYGRINKDGKKTMIFPQRLVAKLFVPNPENKPEVNHIDGNKLNNHFKNLEWATRKENIQHALKNKLHDLNGERCPLAKFKNEDILEIRSRFKKDSSLMYNKVAKEYNMSASNLRGIVIRKYWKHI